MQSYYFLYRESQVCLILQFYGVYCMFNGPLAEPDSRMPSELLSEGSSICQVALRIRASHCQRTSSSGPCIHLRDLHHLPCSHVRADE